MIANPMITEERDNLIELSHINQIEDPVLLGKRVKVRAVVSSTSITYSVPHKVSVKTDANSPEESIEIKADEPINLQMVNISADAKLKRLAAYLNTLKSPEKIEFFKETESKVIYWLKIRPEVFSLQTIQDKILDERGYEYKSYDVFVASQKQIVFQPSSLIELTGRVLAHPKNQNLTLMATGVTFPEESESVDIEKLKKLKSLFDNEKSLDDRVNWILTNFEKSSGIKNRRNLSFGCFLGHFTPLYIKFDGDIVRGWGNLLSLGDSTTGKSATEQKVQLVTQAGCYVTAETATQVGLIGSAVQTERGGWYVDWGFLALNDRKLLTIDGANRLSSSNWGSLGESERSGLVTIAKAAKDQAPARTRQIKIANPLNRETGETRNLSDFLHRAQAVATILDKISIARIDLVIFSESKEVSPQNVNVIRDSKYDEKLLLLSESQRWAWSSGIRIIYDQEALELILAESTNLYNKFHTDNIPLVSIDMKYKLARLSAALALLTLSTEDFTNVPVKKEHVERIVSFIDDEYTKAGLHTLAQLERNETIDETEADSIIKELEEIVGGKTQKILTALVNQGRITKDELKSRFELADKNELRPLVATLQSNGLIGTGRGYYPTSKLIQLWRLRFASIALIGTPKNTSPSNSDTTQSNPPSKFEDAKDANHVKSLIRDRRTIDGVEFVSCTEHPEGWFMPDQWKAHKEIDHPDANSEDSGRARRISEIGTREIALTIFKRLAGKSKQPVEDAIFVDELMKTGRFQLEQAKKIFQDMWKGGVIYEVNTHLFKKA